MTAHNTHQLHANAEQSNKHARTLPYLASLPTLAPARRRIGAGASALQLLLAKWVEVEVVTAPTLGAEVEVDAEAAAVATRKAVD